MFKEKTKTCVSKFLGGVKYFRLNEKGYFHTNNKKPLWGNRYSIK